MSSGEVLLLYSLRFHTWRNPSPRCPVTFKAARRGDLAISNTTKRGHESPWCFWRRYMSVSKNRGNPPQNGWWKWWKTLLKRMIWGYHYFWKHPYRWIGDGFKYGLKTVGNWGRHLILPTRNLRWYLVSEMWLSCGCNYFPHAVFVFQ